MKYFVIISLLLLLSAGCSGEKTDSTPQKMGKNQLVQEAADKLTGMFMQDLKSELMAAMKDGGPANAIAVCNVRAPEIADAHSESGVWSIKRVTDRPRNLENMADDHELGVMNKFRDTTNRVEAGYGEWQVSESRDTSFVYYKPIRTGDLCLNCHGPKEQIDQPVREQLAELYPEDEAVGYTGGDLRGMFVVTMEWPAARSEARELVLPAEEAE